MQIWLDSINLELIRKAKKLGVLYGVTTNPSLLSRSPRPFETIQALLDAQEGPITVQVIAEEAPEMIHQGKQLHEISSRIIVKVPVTTEGLETIHALSKNNIRTMATVVFHPHQALLASLAGADYIAPYLSHMQKSDPDALSQLETMLKVVNHYGMKTKILVASLRTQDQISLCLKMGAHAITLKDAIFKEMVEDHEMTLQRVEIFTKDWSAQQSPNLFANVST
jgi:TalC/MipB family fructose-6-phosphate aldolase